MRTAIIRLCLMLTAASALSINASAQTSGAAASKATAAISGRVTLGEQGAPNIEVILAANRQGVVGPNIQQAAPLTATTDADGRYQLTGVPAGRYRLWAYAPAYIVQGEMRNPYEAGKALTVAEGETVENMDFALVRGGVITGQVTDPDGKPVIEEMVSLIRVRDDDGRARMRYPGSNVSPVQTDDRGIYRFFGLDAGRYRVAAGAGAEDGMIRMGVASYHQRTFHPDTVTEAEAKVIELDAGEVEENIDIKLARAAKGFAASGRVVDAETGKPVAGIMIGIGIIKENMTSTTSGQAITNSQGEFRLDGLAPNGYAAFAVAQGGESYSEPARFEITSGDVAGLEIKMQRGGSISGVVALEGVKDPAVLAQLVRMRVHAWPATNDRAATLGGNTIGNINPDGTFRISGLRPGRVRLQPAYWEAGKGFTLLRIEHNSAEMKEVELHAGEHLTGVRMVFTYGQGSIVGRVEVKGGALPPGTRMSVGARREGQAADAIAPNNSAEVDARGQFLLEGLAPGTYKVTLQAWNPNADEPARLPPMPPVQQTVTISGNARQEAVLVLDLTPREGHR